MSLGKKYGDTCGNETCDSCLDGICQKHKDLFDTSVPAADRLAKVLPIIAEHMMMKVTLDAELEMLAGIANTLSNEEDIEDILSDVETRINQDDKKS